MQGNKGEPEENQIAVGQTEASGDIEDGAQIGIMGLK